MPSTMTTCLVHDRGMSRRRLLALSLAAIAGSSLLAACGGSAAQGPAAAASTPAAAAPTTAAPAAAAPTTAPSGTAPAKAAGKVSMSIATYAGHVGDWERVMVKQWQDKHPDVTLRVDEAPYNEQAKKQLLQIAAGDMQDVTFSGIKWYPYSIFKGAFRPIDDYVQTHDPGKDDFLKSCWQNAMFEGKLYGLPYQIDNGNLAIVIFNLDLLGAKGAKLTTDDWTYKDFTDLAVQTTDPGKKVWGASYLPTTFYDFASLSRTWGTDIFSQDAKKLLLNTDPKNVEAARWLTDLRAKYKAAPNRDESQNLDCAAGKLATTNDSISGIQATTAKVGDKFKWDIALFPKGPTGLRGYHTFTEVWSIYAKSKQPELGYDLQMYLSSTEAGIYAATKADYGPNCRKSVWSNPDVMKTNPSFPRVFKWISEVEGPFPIPYNLKYSELQDKWQNTSLGVFYGEVPFEQGMAKVQEECQKIMDLPRS